MSTISRAPLEEIMAFARLSPSGDNTQPWLFVEESDGTLLLCRNHPEEIALESYYSMSGTPLSLGTVLESVVIAARHFGFETAVLYDPYVHERNDLVARLKFTESEGVIDQKEEILFQALKERKTNRWPFHRRPLLPKHKESLVEIVKKAGASLQFIEGGEMLKQLGVAWGFHDDFYWEHDVLRENFAKIVCFDRTATRLGTGLPLKTLGLGVSRYFIRPVLLFARYFPWARKIIRFQSQQTDAKLAVDSAAFGFIFLPKHPGKKVFEPGWEGSDYVRAGRAVQRLWLETTTLGLALQPTFTFVVMVSNEKNPRLGEKFLLANSRMLYFLRQALPNIDQEMLVFAFRIGYPKKQNVPKSPRKKVAEIFRKV